MPPARPPTARAGTLPTPKPRPCNHLPAPLQPRTSTPLAAQLQEAPTPHIASDPQPKWC